MKICSTLASILDDRDHEIRVLISNIVTDKDREELVALGMRQSEVKGNTTFVGNLKPSQINFLSERLLSQDSKIEAERAVPRSAH